MTLDPKALDHCDREPIHIPGSVQDFGALIATDLAFTAVTRASTNAAEMLGRPGENLLGGSVLDVFPSVLRHELRNVLGHPTIALQREHVAKIDTPGGALDVSAHVSGEEVLLEFLPEPAQAENRTDPIAAARAALSGLATLQHLDQLLQRTVDSVRRLTGHPRVMGYRFLPDDSGEVIAESCSPELKPYLRHRFPAWDIPKPARELYLKMPLRIIADTEAPTFEIASDRPDRAPLDLSLSTLRSTSPIHLEYLRNMGVQSSMSMPLIVDGALWGLIACHDDRARVPSQELLFACELTGQLASMHIQALEDRRRESVRNRAREAAVLLVDSLTRPSRSTASSDDLIRALDPLLDSNAFVFQGPKGSVSTGNEPGLPEMARLDPTLEDAGDELTVIENLSECCPDGDFGDYRGVAAFRVGEPEAIRAMFFRHGVVREIVWGGEPQKTLEPTPAGGRLTPRGSFETYVETVRGRCEPFSADDLEMLSILRSEVDRALQSRQAQDIDQRRLRRIIDELNHRMRNVFAVVQSLARQSSESADSLEHYSRTLEDRILALAKAHDTLIKSHRDAAPLRELIAAELQPYRDPRTVQASMHGPDLNFSTDAASMLVLVIHELAANASRHGAFSTPEGSVEVRWTPVRDTVELSWVESNGPPVSPPTEEGFGLSIIRHTFSTEFDAETSIHFAPSGFEARFSIPSGLFTKPAETPAPAADNGADGLPETAARFSGHALVIEDDFVLAMEMQRRMERLGLTADVVRDEMAAEMRIAEQEYDVAVLDLQMHGLPSRATADALRAKGIPFAVVSGRESTEDLGEDHLSVPFLTKPTNDAAVAEFLLSLQAPEC